MPYPSWLDRLPLPVIQSEAKKAGINWILLAAVAEKESSGRQWALRYEPNWAYFFKVQEHAILNGITEETEKQSQKFSYGYCQIMLSVARELGFSQPAGKLFETHINFYYAAQKLAQYQIMPDAIAAYNAGSPRKTGDGKYVNQNYVSKVMNLISQIEESTAPGAVS